MMILLTDEVYVQYNTAHDSCWVPAKISVFVGLLLFEFHNAIKWHYPTPNPGDKFADTVFEIQVK